MQSQVRFNKILEKIPQNIIRAFGAESSKVQQGSGKDSGESREALVQSQKDSGEDFGEGSRRFWYKIRSSSTGFREKSRRFWGKG